jgi:translation initiation factor IF-3
LYERISTKHQRVNDQIRSPKVRVVGPQGEALGIKPTDEAIRLARENSMDLVEVAPNAAPPVARIMDYGAYRYRLQKQAQQQKKHQKKIEIKGIRIGMRISEHDFQHKVDQANEFLAEGHKIKLELVMRGREQAFQLRHRAHAKIDEFIKALEEKGMPARREQDTTKQGNRLILMLGAGKVKPSSHS